MAAIQRNLLHRLVINDLAHAVRGGVDDSGLSDNLDVFRSLANFQLNVLRDVRGNREFQIRDRRTLKPRSRNFDAIGANGQGGEKISSCAVGLRGGGDSCGRVGYSDFRIGDGRPARVRDGAIQAGGGLSHRGGN